MSKKHLAIIINPRSGIERQKAIQNTIDAELDHEHFSYEILHTEYLKHGTELARDAAKKGAHAVVAVGGDGSVNDVVSGLINTQTALAIIPKGSGNGMARALEIPLDTKGAINVINRGNSVVMDIGFANSKPFISNAGVGFDALISREFSKSQRRGFAIYSWLVTKHLWMYNEQEWNINIDGKELNMRAFLVNVANGSQFGYNFKIAPEASWTDGLLDLIIIKKFPKLLGGALVLRAMNGTITDSTYVEHYRGTNIKVSNPKLNIMQTDGDAHACESTIHFHVQPALQKVIVP